MSATASGYGSCTDTDCRAVSLLVQDAIQELRAYVRQRESLEQQKGVQINMMNKAMQLLRCQATVGGSKTESKVGMNIICAIVAGEWGNGNLTKFEL